ncbi:11144_t:CDS:2, partial [Racocetra persica]
KINDILEKEASKAKVEIEKLVLKIGEGAKEYLNQVKQEKKCRETTKKISLPSEAIIEEQKKEIACLMEQLKKSQNQEESSQRKISQLALPDAKLPTNKKQITLQTRRRNHYTQLVKQENKPESTQLSFQMEKYPRPEEIKQIELEAGTLITGQLQIENFPVKNCPQLKELNCSYNEVKDFSVADYYNVVSYIGVLDDDLYQQLRAGLPGTKHEDYRRLCLGCLTKGGHKNNPSYNYQAEVKLAKGGTIEYAVTANGNKRQTCEIPEEGGLLMVSINATNGGTLKIKRNEIKNLQKSSETEEKNKLVEEKTKLEKTVQELEENLKRKELEEGRADLQKKLQAVEKQLAISEKQRQELQFEYDNLKRTLHGKRDEIAELKRIKEADQQRFTYQIEELEKEKELTENEVKILQKLKELFSTFHEHLDSENVVKLEKILQEYKEADFTNTPHLPDIFRLKNEGLSDYLDSSLRHYHKWQETHQEAEKLRTNIRQEETKNAEKIAELNQKVKELQIKNQAQPPKEKVNLQEQLKQAQDYAQELKNTLKITVPTLEKEIQTDLTSEDINQKDLKIEELRQQQTKQKRLSIKTKPVNPSLGDSSWANFTAAIKSPDERGGISPSQIRERERQKKQQIQEQSAQIIQKDYGEKDNKELLNKIETLKNDNLRLLADLDNQKKNHFKEMREISTMLMYNTSKRLIEKILPLFDSYERALEISQTYQDPKVKQFLAGFQIAFAKTQKDFFQQEKIEEIKVVPRQDHYDHNLHEIISSEKNDDYPERTILQVSQKGYCYQGKVLRPAEVVVSKKKDLGTTRSCVSIRLEDGTYKVVINENGSNTTHSMVLFDEEGNLVEVGEVAKKESVLKPQSVVYEAKRLMGRKFDSPEVQKFKKLAPFEIVSGKNGDA